VSGIVDPLMAALFLGAFLCYLRGWIAASLALFALAAFEKETALVLPAWILTHAMLFRQGPRLRRALVVAPYAIVAAIYLIVRTAVIQGFHTVINPLPAAVVAATWPAMLCFYLAQLVVPLRLSIFHYVAYVTRLDMAHFVLPVLTLAAIAAGIACWARRDRRALLAATLILFPLLPVLDLTVFTQDEVVHDRYLYLPSVGFCVLAMLAWKRLAPHTAAVVLALPALAMAGITVRESRFWNDDLTLFRHAYQVAPQHYLARQNLGVALLMRGEFADAIPYFQLVLARDPRNPETLYSLGRCYFGLQEWDGAAQYFGEAAAIDPAASNYHLYLGLSDFHASRLDDAEREIRHALDLRPRVSSEFRLYHMSLADVLAGKGQAAAARAEYTAELAENPESLKAFEGSRR
jgi:tetratricopeptide (TPR) repeat protein